MGSGSATSPGGESIASTVTTGAEWGEDFLALAGDDGIIAEEIFAYTYAVLHDPHYRQEYAVDLLREFPRLPLFRDFHHWAGMGQTLLGLPHRVRVG